MVIGFVRRFAHLANGFVRRDWLRLALCPSCQRLRSVQLASFGALASFGEMASFGAELDFVRRNGFVRRKSPRSFLLVKANALGRLERPPS
jgi:hypothetical protein